MAERLIPNTDILISAERDQLDLTAAAGGDADATLPAIVLAGYPAGLHLAATDAQRARGRAFLDIALQGLPIENYTPRVDGRHSALLAHVRRSGTTRGAL